MEEPWSMKSRIYARWYLPYNKCFNAQQFPGLNYIYTEPVELALAKLAILNISCTLTRREPRCGRRLRVME